MLDFCKDLWLFMRMRKKILAGANYPDIAAGRIVGIFTELSDRTIHYDFLTLHESAYRHA
jgi:hypothetical protein